MSRQGAKESDILANASIISRSDDASQELQSRRGRDSSLQDRSSMVKPIEQPKINILASARQQPNEKKLHIARSYVDK